MFQKWGREIRKHHRLAYAPGGRVVASSGAWGYKIPKVYITANKYSITQVNVKDNID